jgi:hypothetical protein
MRRLAEGACEPGPASGAVRQDRLQRTLGTGIALTATAQSAIQRLVSEWDWAKGALDNSVTQRSCLD